MSHSTSLSSDLEAPFSHNSSSLTRWTDTFNPVIYGQFIVKWQFIKWDPRVQRTDITRKHLTSHSAFLTQVFYAKPKRGPQKVLANFWSLNSCVPISHSSLHNWTKIIKYKLPGVPLHWFRLVLSHIIGQTLKASDSRRKWGKSGDLIWPRASSQP